MSWDGNTNIDNRDSCFTTNIITSCNNHNLYGTIKRQHKGNTLANLENENPKDGAALEDQHGEIEAEEVDGTTEDDNSAVSPGAVTAWTCPPPCTGVY